MASKKALNKTLQHRLSEKARFGHSKHDAKQAARSEYLKSHGNLRGYNPSRVEGIYSIKTMETYRAATQTFSNWAYNNGCRQVDQISRESIAIYLKDRENQGLSAWTISRDLAALNKIFNYNLTKQEIGLRERYQHEITRSRGQEQIENRDFSKYSDAMTIAQSCGCRRQSITELNSSNFLRNEVGTVIAIQLHEKGGKDRIAPLLNDFKERVTDIVDSKIALQTTENERLFNSYDKHIDNHEFRAIYAASLLHQLEQEREQGIPLCNGDFDILLHNCNLNNRDNNGNETYKGHDRDLMGAVSGSLGHNRLEVLNSYSRYM